MFKIEIHGLFNLNQQEHLERGIKNLDYFIYPEKTKYTNQKSISCYDFITPLKAVDKSCEYTVLSFYRKDFSPYISPEMLDFFLDRFADFKDRILIELLFGCTDINLKTSEKKEISANEASMNMFIKQSKLFFNEADNIFYYTYEEGGLHIVWTENTETLLSKYNLIAEKGYKGIFLRNTPLALEGNWEALYKMKKA